MQVDRHILSWAPPKLPVPCEHMARRVSVFFIMLLFLLTKLWPEGASPERRFQSTGKSEVVVSVVLLSLVSPFNTQLGLSQDLSLGRGSVSINHSDKGTIELNNSDSGSLFLEMDNTLINAKYWKRLANELLCLRGIAPPQ